MADMNIPSCPMPGDWSGAFAGIPLERVPADAWARLSAALPAQASASASPSTRSVRGTPRRPALRMCLAAAASIVVALPMAWWLGTSSQAPTRAPGVAPVVTTGMPVRNAAADIPREARGVPALPADSARDAVASGPMPEIPHPAAGAEPMVDARSQPSATGRRVLAAPVRKESTAAMMTPAGATQSTVADAAPADSGADPVAGPAAPLELAALRQESARLEALVAYARDDRMASAPAAVMSASIDDRIRLIDAVLMQPGLDDVARSSLWSERVGALQELASLESTQRWMAAHGASMATVARVD